MKTININFTIDTLEDFHIGTGLDCAGLYDDGQVKDSSGNPAIRSETLKGLLRQSCLEVKRVFNKKFDDAFDELFYFKNLGSLDLFIEYKSCDSNNPFIIHTFTAIDEKTGTGKEGTLREIEFGSKGCKFKVELHFEMKNDDKAEDVKNLLELGIKNLKWMGGYRRRGFGEIKCNIGNDSKIKLHPKLIISDEKIRIFLELQDDVCIAGAGQTGNIIHTLDYISGTTALGMLRNPLLKLNKSTEIIDDGNISVTNFYPIGKKWHNDLKSKIVIPVPSSLRKNKGVDKFAEYYCDKREDKNVLEIPHWALDAKPTEGDKKSFKNIVSQDTLIDDKGTDQDGASDKSISGEYLIFPNKEMKWKEATFFKPKKNLIMRNRITETTQSTDDDAIFTQEMIEKGTIFVGEIEFNTKKDSKKFQQIYKDWLDWGLNFHTGRGGKSIKVVAVEKVPDSPELIQNQKSNNQFTITLFSDAILYDEKLMPETVIHPQYLNLENQVKLVNAISSTRIHQSFSGLAGLRRFSDRVISKGSCFLYELEDRISWTEIQDNLEKIQENRIGYKKDEGFGQVVVNLSIHQFKKKKDERIEYKFEIDKAKHQKFIKTSLEEKEKNYQEANQFKIKYPKDSKTFTNRIIAYMEAGKKEQEITDEIDKNIQKNTRAADNWKVFNEKIWKKTKDYKIIRLAHLIMKQEVK